MFESAFRDAVNLDESRTAGRALGLSDAEIREVVDVWVAAYRRTPWPISWKHIRSAMLRREMGDAWRPAFDQGGNDE